MDDIGTSVEKLQNAVLEVCGTETQWPARVAAGVYATLDFAVANPEAAYALLVDARATQSGGPHRGVLDLFSQVLATEVPRGQRLAGSTDAGLVGAIAIVVGDHLRSGNVERLREMGPELVHLVLLPYVGFAEAKRWAERTAG